MRLAFVAALPLAFAVACSAFTTATPATTTTPDGGVAADASATPDASVGPCAVPNVYCNDFENVSALDGLQKLANFNGTAVLAVGAGPTGGEVLQATLSAPPNVEPSTVAAYSVAGAPGLTFEGDLRITGGGNSNPVFVFGVTDANGSAARLTLDQSQRLYIDTSNGNNGAAKRYSAGETTWLHVVIQGSNFTVGPVGGAGETMTVTLPPFDASVAYFFGAATDQNEGSECQVEVDWVRITQP